MQVLYRPVCACACGVLEPYVCEYLHFALVLSYETCADPRGCRRAVALATPQSTARDCAYMRSSYPLGCACLALYLALLARDVSRFARFHILILSVEVRYG
jgi:hypothetical protein